MTHIHIHNHNGPVRITGSAKVQDSGDFSPGDITRANEMSKEIGRWGTNWEIPMAARPEEWSRLASQRKDSARRLIAKLEQYIKQLS